MFYRAVTDMHIPSNKNFPKLNSPAFLRKSLLLNILQFNQMTRGGTV
jgi:hypothetical protein